jgi:hypothetical protein
VGSDKLGGWKFEGFKVRKEISFLRDFEIFWGKLKKSLTGFCKFVI